MVLWAQLGSSAAGVPGPAHAAGPWAGRPRTASPCRWGVILKVAAPWSRRGFSPAGGRARAPSRVHQEVPSRRDKTSELLQGPHAISVSPSQWLGQIEEKSSSRREEQASSGGECWPGRQDTVGRRFPILQHGARTTVPPHGSSCG